MTRRVATQPDLFANQSTPQPGDDDVDEGHLRWLADRIVRHRQECQERLRAIQAAEEPLWENELLGAMAINDFRWRSETLPEEEGKALFAAFDAEITRVYKLDPDDPYGYKLLEQELAEKAALEGAASGA